MTRPTINDILAKCSPTVRALNPTLFPGLGLPDDDKHSPASPIVERRSKPRALAKGKTQKGDSRRFFVRVTSYRVRLLDEDNLCEKYGVDCLRYSGILPGDSAAEARIVTSQEKVSRKDEERTTFEISLIP